MRYTDQILQEFDREIQTTERVLSRVPDDKLDWRPHPRSMSLGQLAMHLATIPRLVAAMIQSDTFQPSLAAQPVATSRADVLHALSENSHTLRSAVGAMDDAALGEAVTFVVNGKTAATLPKTHVLRSVLLNHSYHHRGQLSVYLRELDVPVPSIYGPSADDDPFA